MKKIITLFSVLALVAGSLLLSGCGAMTEVTFHSNFPWIDDNPKHTITSNEEGEELTAQNMSCTINLANFQISSSGQADISTLLSELGKYELKSYVYDGEIKTPTLVGFNNKKDGSGLVDLDLSSIGHSKDEDDEEVSSKRSSALIRTLLAAMLENANNFYAQWSWE